MSSITISNLDQHVAERLYEQATRHGLSVEDEARAILSKVLKVNDAPKSNLASSIRARFAPIGGVELAITPREPMREATNFQP